MSVKLSVTTRNMLFSFLRGLAGGAICIGAKSLTTFILFFSAATESGLFANSNVANYIIYIISFAASILIYGSVIGCLCKYNPADLDSYLSLDDRELSFFGRIKYYLKKKEFYLEVGSFSASTFIAAFFGACPEIFGMIYAGEGIAPNTNGILPALVSIILIFPIYLFKKCDMLPYFEKLIKMRDEEKVRGRVQPILRILLIFILYPALSPLLPLIPMMAFTTASVVASVVTAITVSGTLGVIVAICIFAYTLRLVIRIIRRKRLIRKIEDAAAAADCRAADFENSYASLIFRGRQMRFNIYRGNVVYNVLLISAISKRFPICFTSDRSGYHDHIIGIKHANFTIMHHYFGYEPRGDGIQIMVICPEPKSVFIIEGNQKKRLYNAGQLYEFTAYDKDAFLGAMRRGVLGKSDGKPQPDDDPADF